MWAWNYFPMYAPSGGVLGFVKCLEAAGHLYISWRAAYGIVSVTALNMVRLNQRVRREYCALV